MKFVISGFSHGDAVVRWSDPGTGTASLLAASTIYDGALLIENPGAPRDAPWIEAEAAAVRCRPEWAVMLAEAACAARRWEGSGPVGVRVWYIESDGYLYGFNLGHPWASSTMHARCSKGHKAPDQDCSCGLYAVCPEAVSALSSAFLGGATAVGVVSLFGRVMRHHHGWRAEYARIREVWWLAERGMFMPKVALYPGVTWHKVNAWARAGSWR